MARLALPAAYRSSIGMGTTTEPAPANPLNQAIDGAKAWMSPTGAMSEIKGAFTGTMPAPARLAGLALVPLAAIAIITRAGGKKRR